jgi:hypothetical protein
MSAINKDIEFKKAALRDRLMEVLTESQSNPLMKSHRFEIYTIIECVRKSIEADADECSRLLSKAVEHAKPFAGKFQNVEKLLTEAHGFMLSTKVMVIDWRPK